MDIPGAAQANQGVGQKTRTAAVVPTRLAAPGKEPTMDGASRSGRVRTRA
ncbi:hypothetical protein OG552_25175 [Streptomyces sp. NBC_01476]|nr:hypothetical protein [Streptomyces sp. NBC_01476]